MNAVNVCRFFAGDSVARVGVVSDDAHVVDVTAAGIATLSQVLESADPVGLLNGLDRKGLPAHRISDVVLRPPIERQEVWAAGVTYLSERADRGSADDAGSAECLW